MPQDIIKDQDLKFQTSKTEVLLDSPALWSLVDSLLSEDQLVRAAALHELTRNGIPRLSRLVAYLLATRISDVNIKFRSGIVECLGDVLIDDEDGFSTSNEVRAMLLTEMSGMRQREIYCILQVTAIYPQLKMHGKTLICTNQFAAKHLVDICANNKLDDLMRREALVMIAMAGFTNCLPDLTSLEKRISYRLGDLEINDVAVNIENQERSLLFSLKDTINILSEL